MSFSTVELIIKKREHEVLSTDEINWLVDAYTKGVVADEQMSAMSMAILLNGMERREILDLTMAMIASGERLDFSGLSKPTADKHSTGGVGDKITLPLAPLVASYGVAVPQLSGRGLGTPVARWTRLRLFQAGRQAYRTQSFTASSPRLELWFVRRGAGWRLLTRNSMHCEMSRERSRRFRSSPHQS